MDGHVCRSWCRVEAFGGDGRVMGARRRDLRETGEKWRTVTPRKVLARCSRVSQFAGIWQLPPGRDRGVTHVVK